MNTYVVSEMIFPNGDKSVAIYKLDQNDGLYALSESQRMTAKNYVYIATSEERLYDHLFIVQGISDEQAEKIKKLFSKSRRKVVFLNEVETEGGETTFEIKG